MRRLRTSIWRKRPDLWKNNSWFLHYDIAPFHKAIILREFLATTGTHIGPQPPYSPDLAPTDFWLFNKLKRPLWGHRFDTIEEIPGYPSIRVFHLLRGVREEVKEVHCIGKGLLRRIHLRDK
uniref:Tc1-like transposase DDE domain-containing protein n=1 Tax=Anopheles minimus TaxID=112268 RepID=A0A182VSN6_9DIPT